MGGFTRHATPRELEIRNENRYVLHQQDKKRCTRCEVVFHNIREHFDIHHKRKDGSYGYSGPCKECLKVLHADRTERYKRDINLYSKKLLPQLRNRAKEYGIEFDLTKSDLVNQWKKQNGNCYYINEPMDLQATTDDLKSSHVDFPSVDRLIPDNGYVSSNIVWCKWGINRMKSNLTEQDFLSFCRIVIENHS